MDHIEAGKLARQEYGGYCRPIAKVRVANGGWRATSEAIGKEEQALAAKGVQWTGRCQTCFQIKEAGSLMLKTLPFGRGEVWVCNSPSGCGDRS